MMETVGAKQLRIDVTAINDRVRFDIELWAHVDRPLLSTSFDLDSGKAELILRGLLGWTEQHFPGKKIRLMSKPYVHEDKKEDVFDGEGTLPGEQFAELLDLGIDWLREQIKRK